MRADYKSIRDEVVAMSERYAQEVSRLYDNALVEIANLMKGVELDESKPFTFDDYGLQEKVDAVMDNLENAIMRKVGDGVAAAYSMSYKNCEALVKRAIGETASEKVKKAFMSKVHSKKAAQAFMRNVPSVSGRLWNGETLALMTSAVEDSIRQGMSATKMASRIKQYLNDPDDWHRRFRYKAGEDKDGNPIYRRKWKKREYDEATGKYKWVDHKPGEPHPGHVGGPGAYRSSYKNALRYARTTTNIAYRTADYDQYQEMPFVVGIEIRLSNNHPVTDICDTLAGQYPKEFKWTGWHPNCRCYQVPILANHDEVDKMVDKILEDEDPSSVECEDAVTEMPSNFTSWLKSNEERVGEAVSKGTLPYFLKDNGTIDDDGVFHLKDFTAPKHELTILEKAQMRHAARTDEEVADIQARADERQQRLKEYGITKNRASNFLGMAGDWHEVDFSSLQDLFAQVQGKSFYRPAEMADLKKAVADIKAQIQAQQAAEKALSDVIPDVHKWHTQFGISDLQSVKDAVANTKSKMAAKYGYSKWEDIPLNTQKTILEKELHYATDPTYLKPHTLYPTWEVAQAVYTKEIAIVDDAIAWQATDAHLANIQTYLQTHKNAKALASVVDEAVKLKQQGASPAIVDAKLAEADKKIAAVQSATAKKQQAKQQKLQLEKKSLEDVKKNLLDNLANTPPTDKAQIDALKKDIAVIDKKIVKIDKELGQYIDPDAYSDARRNAAVWDKGDGSLAAKTLRDDAGKVWQAATDAQRDAMWDYTGHYCDVNEPLTYRRYMNRQSKQRWTNKVNNMTDYIEQSSLPADMWFQRGDGGLGVIESMLKFAGDTSLTAADIAANPSVLVGKTIQQGAFMSAGSQKGRGFVKPVILNIYAPKGTKATYVEPFSQYGCGAGRSWDGKQEFHKFSSEHETIFQRGTKMRVTKVEYKNGSYYIDVEVIGYELKDLSLFDAYINY